MNILLKLMIISMNIVYFFIKLLPTRNKIVFMSRQSNKINIDFELLKNELEGKYKVVFLCKTLDGKENAKMITAISYGFHMFRQMYHLATSKVCILDTYIPTISILKHKKKLTIIQMWHSNGTMKKFGYSALSKREGTNGKYAKMLKMHNNYDIVFSSSEAYVDHLIAGFRIEKEKIQIYSLPRIDLLNDKEYEKSTKEKIYASYPELNSNKKNVIYAPTFRKDESKFEEHLNELIENFNFDKYNFILKLHPLSKVEIKNEKVLVEKKYSTFDMLFIADALISDYSCVIYEAGVRNIPLYFYAYDLSYYDFIRGIALDYSELPGYTEQKGSEIIKDLDKEYDMEYLKKFIDKYVENTEDCTKKIVKLIEEKMK